MAFLARRRLPAAVAHAGPRSDSGTDSQSEGAAWLGNIRLVVLDRDGVINRRRLALVRKPSQLELLPGVGDALATFKDLGLRLHVATNQPHAAWGWVRDLPAIHGRLEALAAAFGVRFDGIHACTHTVFARCTCRKPRPGMVRAAMEAEGILPRRTLMVGDHPRDIKAGKRAGAWACFLQGGVLGPVRPHTKGAGIWPDADLVLPDLFQLAELMQRVRDA